MFEKLKNAVSHFSVKFYLALFLFVWLVGWVLKALYGYQFDLDKLVDLYKWLLGQFVIESGLNTEIPLLRQLGGKNDGK